MGTILSQSGSQIAAQWGDRNEPQSDPSSSPQSVEQANANAPSQEPHKGKIDVKLDTNLPRYHVSHGPTGLVRSVGSDTMISLMRSWAERFKSYYRGVRVEIEGQGSSKAMPALIEGTSSFGPMSRPLKLSEIEEFENRFGYKPTLLPVGIDLVGLLVHQDCPLESISLEQIDAIFSSTRRRGHAAITTWGDLGLTGEWAREPIVLYGRNAASGTYGFFKDRVLNEGDFQPRILEQPVSSAVVSAIASNRFAMGYSGMGGNTDLVKPLMISERNGASGIGPSEDNALDGSYPLARYLFIAIHYKPNSRLDPTRREFLKFLYSREGQEIVALDGYLPINPVVAQEALKEVGIVTSK
jgi:phosphate transport system substrate-binding protein